MAEIRVRVNYSEIENKKDVTDNVFRGLKPKSKVGMNHFKLKVTGVCYAWVSMSYQELAICYLRFRNILKYF